MSTPLAVSCPNCGAGLKLKSKTFVGKKVPCPKCKQPFLVEEPEMEDEFLADDDFGGGDDYQEEEEEEERPRAKKGGKGGKGKKKSKGGGGSGIALMIGGAVLGIAVLGGIVYGAMTLLSGMGGSNGWTAWMPADAELVVRVRPAEIANTPFLKPVMDHPTLSKLANMPAGNNADANSIAAALNLSIRDIDSVTFGGKAGSGNTKEVMVVIRTKAAVDAAKFDQAATALSKETYAGKSVYAVSNSTPKMLLYPAASDTIVIGPDGLVRAAIDRNGAGLDSKFKLTDSKAQIFVVAAPSDMNSLKGGSPFGGGGLPFGTKQARLNSISFALDINTDATLTMTMNSLDTLNAQVQTDQLKKELADAKAQLGASGGLIDPAAGLKAHVKTMLDGATISVSRKTATVKMTLPGQIVPDGLTLAAPFMPMIEQMVAQKAATSSTAAAPSMTQGSGSMSAPSLTGPGGITSYPGAVINAGNNAQNRINNLGDQHNNDLSAQMQEGAGASHGATPSLSNPNAGQGGASPTDPAEMMRRSMPPAGANPAAGQGNGNATAGAAHGSSAPQAGPPGGAPGAAAGHGAPGGSPNPEEAMRRQMQQGAPLAPNGGGGNGGDDATRKAMEEQMRRGMRPGGAAPGNQGGNDNRAAMEEQMRRQQQGGQPAAQGGQNGDAKDPNKPAPRSRSRRRTD